VKREDLIIRESFIASHNNGAIWAVNLDALYDFEDIAINKFLEDLKEIKRPSTPSALAINLKETAVTKRVAEAITDGLVQAGTGVRKVVFVGLEKESVRIMNHVMKNRDIGFACKYFSDFMEAKDWLI
jgi:hypothetical protein